MTTSSIGSSGRTYSSIASWIAASPANLVTSTDVWKGELYNDSEFLITDSSTVADFTGKTTSTTYYFWLTTASGQGFKDASGASTAPLKYDQSKGAAIRTTNGYGRLVNGSGGQHVLLEGLQIQSGSGGENLRGSNVRTKDCIVELGVDGWFKQDDAASPWGICINSLFMFTSSAWTFALFGSRQQLYNCTVVRPSDLTTASGSGVVFNTPYGNAPLIKNCAVFGLGLSGHTVFSGTLASYQAGTGYIATDIASGSIPGSNNQAGLTYSSQFENTSNSTRDWRPKSGGSLANGTRDNTNTADLDIIGAARSTSTPTIGAREFAGGGGGGGSIAAISNYHRMLRAA